MFSRVWCCNASLNENSSGLQPHKTLCYAIVIGEEILFLPVRIELSVLALTFFI